MQNQIALGEIVDIEATAQLLEQHSQIKLIDVRTPAEFESSHIPGSYNVPLDLLPEHREELSDALRSPAILICRSGTRARQAAQLLREARLDRVHILEGGIAAWEAAGKPLRRGRQRWGLERQVRGIAGTLVVVGSMAGLLVSPKLGLIAAAVGGGLAYSAATDTCAMGMLLSKLPYNRGATCDMRQVVATLATGAEH